MQTDGSRNGKHVLVIDDESLIRWSLAETLADAGYEVSEAADGRSAVRILEERPDTIDMVLLDLRLPDSSDLQLLSTVRALAPEAHVVMMTAYGSPELTREALERGAERVIHKPFDMRSLRVLVEQLCAQAS